MHGHVRTAAVVGEAVEGLAGGKRDLAYLVGQLDTRLPVDLHQLVHAAQSRLRLAGDKVRADPEGVDLVALLGQRVEHVLIDVVARHDLEPLQARLPLRGRHLRKGPPDALGEVRQVARVEAHAHGGVAQVRQRQRHGQEVGHAGAERIVGIDEAEEVGGPPGLCWVCKVVYVLRSGMAEADGTIALTTGRKQ